MMRYRYWVVFPLLWAAAFLIGDTLFFGTPGYPVFLRTEVELVKGLALFGSWAAALRFERGDYLRRAWFLIGGVLALLLLRDLTLAPLGFEAMGQGNLEVLRSVLVTLANLSGVAGTWLLARTWKVADLSLPGSRKGQAAVVAVAVVLAVAFASPGLVTSGSRLLEGDLTATAGAASAFGDMIILCLLAPLFLTALALRGGLISWPWALLTASNVAWLLYDALAVLGPALGLDAHAARTSTELFRALGCTFGFTAGLAQRAVVDHLRRLGGGPPPAV